MHMLQFVSSYSSIVRKTFNILEDESNDKVGTAKAGHVHSNSSSKSPSTSTKPHDLTINVFNMRRRHELLAYEMAHSHDKHHGHNDNDEHEHGHGHGHKHDDTHGHSAHAHQSSNTSGHHDGHGHGHSHHHGDGHGHGHSHGHGETKSDESYRFVAMAFLTTTMMLAEIIVGLISGSLTLLSDSLHMLSDLAALIVGYCAHQQSLKLLNQQSIKNKKNKNFDPHNTIGYLRTEIVGALINGIMLLSLSFTMIFEAIRRIIVGETEVTNVDDVLIVGCLGLVINFVGLFIFGHHGHGHSHGGGHGHDHGHSHGGHSHGHNDSHSHSEEENDSHKHHHHGDDHHDEHDHHDHDGDDGHGHSKHNHNHNDNNGSYIDSDSHKHKHNHQHKHKDESRKSQRNLEKEHFGHRHATQIVNTRESNNDNKENDNDNNINDLTIKIGKNEESNNDIDSETASVTSSNDDEMNINASPAEPEILFDVASIVEHHRHPATITQLLSNVQDIQKATSGSSGTRQHGITIGQKQQHAHEQQQTNMRISTSTSSFNDTHSTHDHHIRHNDTHAVAHGSHNDDNQHNHDNNNKKKKKKISEKNQKKKEKASHSHGHSHENMNIRALFLHVLADALGNVAVIISAIMIKYTNFWLTDYIDPITTIIIIILITKVSWPLVQSTINILLDKSPSHINIDAIYDRLNQLQGVLNVHELHVWEVTPGNLMATVHLIIDPQCEVINAMKILDQSKAVLHSFGVHSSVVQREYPDMTVSKQDWVTSRDPCFDLVCKDNDCIPKGTAFNIKKERLKGTDCNKNDCDIDHGLIITSQQSDSMQVQNIAMGNINENASNNKNNNSNSNNNKHDTHDTHIHSNHSNHSHSGDDHKNHKHG